MSNSLTAANLASFARNGYLCPLPGLSQSEPAATLEALEDFERRHGGFGKLLRFKAHLRLEALMAVARHARILDAVEDLIGPDILLFTSTLGRRSALLVRGRDDYGHWDPDPTPRFDDDPLIDAFIRSTFQQYRDQEPSAASAPS